MDTAYLTEKQLRSLKIQFLFITANNFEQAELKQRIVPYKPGCTTIYSSDTVDYTIGYLGSYLIAHIHLPQQGSQQPYASTLSINEAYQLINPLCVIMVGIAFGRDENTQKLGDVLVSQSVKTYGIVRRSTNENNELVTEDRNNVIAPAYRMSRVISSFSDRMNNSQLRYKVHVGTILTGEELIDNKNYKEYLVSQFKSGSSDIIGGEMEAAGLTSVMVRMENMNWMIIKAICDWGDGNKKENKSERQQNAARNAVDFCVRLFSTEQLSRLPNFKKTKLNYNEKLNVLLINGYKLFYIRNKNCCSIKELSKKTNITEKELRSLEDFNVVNNKPTFLTIKQAKAKKIQAALNCGNELFDESYTPEEKFFFGNKGRSSLCPPERAKAVIFDFDGTLTSKDCRFSTWQKIWEYLGYDLQICDSLHRKFTNGDISHKQWCDITAEYFIKKELKKEQIELIAKQICLMPGTEDVFKTLYENRIPIYICSGSIDIIIEYVLGNLNKYVRKIACNQFAYDSSGTKLKAIIGTTYDFEGKANFIKEIAEDLDISTHDIVFVGNSNNDEFAVTSGAKTLVVNPILTSGYNRNIWKYFAGHNVEDLKDILPFLLPDQYLLKEIAY